MRIGEYDYFLGDDGTLDTVVTVHHVETDERREIRCDHDTAAAYRDDDGSFSQEGFELFIEENVADDAWQYFETE